MLSIAYVAQYLGGTVRPGSDMAGSAVGWFDLDEITDPSFRLFAPEQPWLFERAASYSRQFNPEGDVQLEPWSDRRPWHYGVASD
jgi:hypothetical protein